MPELRITGCARLEFRNADFGMRISCGLLFAAFFFLSIFPVGYCDARAGTLAQGGSIKGKVVADIPDQRKALAGAVVKLSGDRLGNKTLEAITDLEGRYEFTGLIAGDYVV